MVSEAKLDESFLVGRFIIEGFGVPWWRSFVIFKRGDSFKIYFV